MCTVKLSFTCQNILSEVNIPKAAVCWLRVNAKARGEEKGRVKWDISVPKHFSCCKWSSVSDPQVRRASAVPWLSSHFLVTSQNWLVLLVMLLLFWPSQSKMSSVDIFFLFSFPGFSTAISVSENSLRKLSKQNLCKNIFCKITPNFCSIWL